MVQKVNLKIQKKVGTNRRKFRGGVGQLIFCNETLNVSYKKGIQK